MVRKIHINFTNKWFYTFVLVIGIFALGVGVWATSHPSPGHTAAELEGVCLSNGTNCLSGGGSLWNLDGSDIYYDAGNVGIGGPPSSSYQLRVVGGAVVTGRVEVLENIEIWGDLKSFGAGEIFNFKIGKINQANSACTASNVRKIAIIDKGTNPCPGTTCYRYVLAICNEFNMANGDKSYWWEADGDWVGG